MCAYMPFKELFSSAIFKLDMLILDIFLFNNILTRKEERVTETDIL